MKKNMQFFLGLIVGIVATAVVMFNAMDGVKELLGVFTPNRAENGYVGRPEEEFDVSSSAAIDWRKVDLKSRAIYSILEKNYLNPIDNLMVQDSMYKGLVDSLGDQYSAYFNKEEFDQFSAATSGTYYGIGVVVQQNPTTGAISVVKTFKKGSSYKAGVLPEDIIYKVEGNSIEGQDLSKVITKIKGEEGTFVNITVLRAGKEIDFKLERTKLEVETIAYEMMEKDGKKLGYIAVSEFDEVTDEQFREAVNVLEKEGMEGLVIDLRDNPGGLLNVVTDMLDRLLPKGLLVYTLDKNNLKEVEEADDEDEFKKPVTVLINGNSASASEIFAGAMQDYKAAIIIGEKSFGKGIVQRILPLSDGSAVKVTVSKYFTPNGRNIHGIGIEPDVKVELDKSKIKKGRLEKKDDNQLNKALELTREMLDKK